DPQAFTHTKPLDGIKKGAALVWESRDTPETAWQHIPSQHRKFVLDTTIRIYILPGFDSAKKATSRGDLQLRMQGNSFLGAFFRVSPLLKINNITDETFLATVKKQYQKKFGRFGEDVVASNMTVMDQGFSRAQEIKYGEYNDPDRSSMRNPPVTPPVDTPTIPTADRATAGGTGTPT